MSLSTPDVHIFWTRLPLRVSLGYITNANNPKIFSEALRMPAINTNVIVLESIDLHILDRSELERANITISAKTTVYLAKPSTV